MKGPTRADAIAQGAERLAGSGVPEPERDARLLYRWAARIDGAALSAALGARAEDDELTQFEQAIVARMRRVPVAQITGEREFWGRRFAVTPDVLDPRPETETLIDAALAGPEPQRILDLGIGSGCILLTLLAEWRGATGAGVDISPAALDVARRNADRLNVADRATLILSDWFEAVEGRFDLIVSNPPYIAEAEIADLDPEVRLHEPIQALRAGADGLAAYREIIAGVRHHLAPEGRVLLEIGPGQADEVSTLLAAAGLRVQAVFRDLDARNRVISARF
ncbi:MAG: peptide chain release factor N(5)-glutamine methyltransferase [Paracoccaceae bacterium]|nr:peptide chain release factor N(5)-glutamine methyltransferase [Paracoccaceae bacterium]